MLTEQLETRQLLAAAPGLVAAYSFDEGAGAVAADASGTGNNGAISGATWAAAGKFGGALSFNGTNSWVTVADAPSLRLAKGMTLEAWVSPSSLTGYRTAILKERAGGLGYALYTSDNSSRPPAAYVNTGGSDLSAVGTVKLALNTWTHLASTYDGTNLRLYVNGALVRTRAAAGTLVTATGPLRFGGNAVWGEYFAGKLDEIRVYDRALAQAEIQSDMNAPVGTPTPDTTPPTLTTRSPAAGASGVATGASVTATFSEPVQPGTIAFALADSTGTPVATTFSYNATTRVATFSPTTALAYSTSYTVTLGGAQDLAGNAMSAPAAWSFTTAAAPPADTTPPAVTARTPASGATGVAVGSAVTAVFSESIQPGSLVFTLKDASNVVVPASVNYNDANKTATLTPTSPLSGGATYTATVSGATDAAGNVMTAPATWSFATVVPAPGPDVVGQWSGVMNFPIVAINMVLLKTGKILMWDGGPDCLGAVTGTLWDPATNTFTPAPSETQQHVRDIFCSAQAILPDGRIIVAGGHECDDARYVGAAIASVFDPATGQWTKIPDMAYRRWYPTATTLPDGRALITAGSDTTVTAYIPVPEIYDPVSNTWTTLTAASKTIPNYPFMFVLPDGRVLAAGSDEAKMATHVLDLATQTWSTVDARVLDAGSAVMYLPGKIMKAGSSYLSPPADNGGSIPSAATTYVLDMTAPAPAWQQTASMAFARTHLNLTILPDGNVLATGGSKDIGGVNPASAVYAAEMWSPATKTWTTLPSAQRPRMYHSTATLLPDGRVLVAGSGHNYFNSHAEFNAEIYSPAYLFKGPRPTITSSPGTIEYDSTFFVGTPNAAAIASVSLVRNGSVTHSVNMDQRFVPLAFEQAAGGLTVHAPVDANLAPPGTYMLFIVDANGVPSVAPFVRFPAGYEDRQAPTAPTNLTATPSVGAVGLAWTAASDNVAVATYDVFRSTTDGFIPSASNRVARVTGTSYVDAGMAAGTYYYVVVAQDAAGNVGPASDQASAAVTGDVTAPAVAVTAPAAGATVSGPVAITATASDDVAVAGVQFFVDGVAFGAEDVTAPYSIAWNSAAVGNGQHTFTARARDAAGNVTTSAGVTVTVSNTASTTGLVAAWGFDDGAGGTARDASANLLNGTVTNATWTAGGRAGGALSFNGTNSWVTVADSTLLRLTTGMTLEAWVKPNTLNGFTSVILKERAGGLAYALYASDGTNRPPAGYINRSGTDRSAVASSAVPLGAWTHLATTYDGANLRVYVNGALAGTRAVTGAMTTSTNPLRIGGNSVWGEYFSGLIDEVRIYGRALTAAEIQSDMNVPVNPPPAPSAVMAAPATAAVVADAGAGAPAPRPVTGAVSAAVRAARPTAAPRPSPASPAFSAGPRIAAPDLGAGLSDRARRIIDWLRD